MSQRVWRPCTEGASILQRVRPAWSRTGLLPCRKEKKLNVLVGRLELLGRGSKWDVGCVGAAAAAGTLRHVFPRHLLGWKGKARDPNWYLFLGYISYYLQLMRSFVVHC